MFWKILLEWMLIGVALEFVTWMLLGIYAGWREDRAGTELSGGLLLGALARHTSWSSWLYHVCPRFVAGAIELCWMFAVWPLEIPLAIVHVKRSIDEQLRNDVNKAS